MAFTILPETPSFANAINNAVANITSPAATMTSKEIADLVSSRHDSVKRSIDRLAEQKVIALPPMEDVPFVDDSGRNRTTSAYIFSGEQGKRDSIVVVAQLSPQFTAALVDRWQELERQVRGVTQVQVQVVIQASVQAAQCIAPFMDAAKAFGFEGNQAILSANRAVKKVVGVDVLDLMGQKALIAPDQEILLTVTEIEQRCGWKRQEGNKRLTALGLQTEYRDHRKKLGYELTDEGRKYGVYLDTGKQHGNGTPIRQLKWKESVLAALQAADTLSMSFLTSV